MGQVFGKDVCSLHCCSTHFTAVAQVADKPLLKMKPSWTTWCSTDQIRRSERKRENHDREKLTGGGTRRSGSSRSSRRRGG